MVSGVKKARVDAAERDPTSTGLVGLPPTVQETVLRYLIHDDALSENPPRGHFTHKMEPLRSMALVSREWRAIAVEAAGVRLLKSLYIREEIRDQWDERLTRTEMLEMRRKVILRRAHLQRLVVGDSPECATIGYGVWCAVLSHAPKLKTLELNTFYIQRRPSNRIVDLTRATVRYCPALESLTLPSRLKQPKATELVKKLPSGHHQRVLSKVVYDALKVWAKHGGLRHLGFPMHEIMKSGKDAKTYIDNVATYCPRIERLDGYAPLYHDCGMIEDEEFWKLDIATWERFCRVCDQLELFDWRCVPFATQFFETFGNHVKPNIGFLAFSSSGNWNWDQYFKAVDSNSASTIKSTGYGASAVRPESALRATPNLRVLRVHWHEGHFRRPTHPNPESFGDEFVEAVAANCQQLSHFTHCAVTTDGKSSVHSFTDRSVRALATLPYLQWVEVVAVSITGEALFDLVANQAAITRRKREYFFHLGDKQEGATSMLFYDVLAGFLQRLVDHKEPIACTRRPVELHLVNMNDGFVEEGWSAAYFGHVMQLAEQAQAQHPSLQLRGLVRGYNEEFGVMKRVLEFTFATEDAKLPRWEEDSGDVEATDVEIDDVFVNRSYYDEPSDDE